LLGECRWCFVAAAAYWLNPLSIIFSAYHGNTDSAVAFFLLLCVWLLSKEKLIGAAIALGASLWIKLSIVLAIPALFFFISNWRRRLLFLSIAGLTALSTYVPVLIQDPKIVYTNVVGYRGLYIHATAGVPVWGPTRVLLFSMIAPPDQWPEKYHGALLFLWQHGWHITLALLLVLAWSRRSRRTAREVCATIGMLYTVVYGFSDSFTFQYFAWAAPFWFF
jgi:Gpi18-like mannosyltransferase